MCRRNNASTADYLKPGKRLLRKLVPDSCSRSDACGDKSSFVSKCGIVSQNPPSVSSTESDSSSHPDFEHIYQLSFVGASTAYEPLRIVSARSPTKHVRFSTIEIRKYPMILGDHPDCSEGPPVCSRFFEVFVY